MKAALTLMFLAVGLSAYQGLCFSDPFHGHCGKPCVHVATQCAPINMMPHHPSHLGGHGGHIFMTPQAQTQTTQQATSQSVNYPSCCHPMMPSYCVQSVIVGGKSEQEEKKEEHTHNNHSENNHEDSDEEEDPETHDDEDDEEDLLEARRANRLRQTRDEERYRAVVERLVDNMNNRDPLTSRRSRDSQNRLRASHSSRRCRHDSCECDDDHFYEVELRRRGNRVYKCRSLL